MKNKKIKKKKIPRKKSYPFTLYNGKKKKKKSNEHFEKKAFVLFI